MSCDRNEWTPTLPTLPNTTGETAENYINSLSQDELRVLLDKVLRRMTIGSLPLSDHVEVAISGLKPGLTVGIQGVNFIDTLRTVREYTGLPLLQSKRLVERACNIDGPVIINIQRCYAKVFAERLSNNGFVVTIGI